ncbi:hypothetical protein BV898_06839 [Hypsibius exemplaris]|uniref:Uncharacterized protein n=1 Tax=Hypsibius exemplaris TaxID=2072580 RepID=A0A1W0WVH8_HYPEX|nr:hypothetical protein BV898_06839 [Hypsibius exemplaris]
MAYIFLTWPAALNPVIYALRSEAFLAAYRNFLCCSKTHHLLKRSSRRDIDPTSDFQGLVLAEVPSSASIRSAGPFDEAAPSAASFNRVARGGPTPAPVIYRQYRTPILEERSSQLAKWDKNPDTDSGRAESDGEYHDSENRSAGSVEDALPHDDGPVHHPTDEAHISSFILENERLLGDIEEERGYRLPLPLDLLQTIV